MRSLALLVLVLLLAGCATQNNPATPTATTSTGSTTPTSTGAAPAGECASTKTSDHAKTPTLVLDTTQGTIKLALFCDKTPITAQEIVNLTEGGCYDGTRFHRVVKDFMDQGGDPKSKDTTLSSSWGTGGPADCGQTPTSIPEEIYCSDGTVLYTPNGANTCSAHGGLGLKYDSAGVLGMARTSAPHSSGSQFFLMAAPASFLDGSYTVSGKTVDDASTQVIIKINDLPCGGGPCSDQTSSRTTPLVVVNKATITWS